MTKALSLIGTCIIRAVGRSLRLHEVNANAWTDHKPGKQVVFAFWHGSQFIPCYHHRNQGIVIMTSQSRDGEIQAGILQRLGYKTVRGSSTRGGDRALVETIHLVRKGNSAAFAVDGPRGPYHQAKPGLAYLAQKTKASIIPVSASPRRSVVMKKAWDKYKLPLLFSPAVIAYGEPITIQREDQLEVKAVELERELNRLFTFTETDFWGTDLPAYLRSHPKPKILIIQPSRIGDVVFSLPTVAAVRKQYPHAWIGWVVDERCAPLLEGNPDVDEVIIFDRSRVSLPYILQFRKYLRDKNLDLSIDLHGLAKSAFLVLLAGARFRIGSAATHGMKELSWLVSNEISPGTKTHCVDRHLAVARHLGCPEESPVFTIPITTAECSAVDAALRAHKADASKPLVVVHPGGGWIARRWFPERFAQLITRLQAEAGVQVVLIGGKEGGAGERGLNEEIGALIDGTVVDLTGKLTLKQMAALLNRCAVFVANEAGPMHMSVGMGTRTVALIGPTDPLKTGPYRNTTIMRHAIDCQPCRERSCPRRECMKLITVDEVYEAVCREISRKPRVAEAHLNATTSVQGAGT